MVTNGFREIELRDKCKSCEGLGFILNMTKIRMLGLRPKDVTKDDTFECEICDGTGFIDKLTKLKLEVQ